MKRTLGTCYYPEHWPEDIWQQDAERMVEAGLTWVRIGEFAWSRIEPTPGDLQWEWLDRAIDVLGKAGLKVVLGTPTATPPRWVLDKHPDMLAIDENGNPRKFGSRRHYCFSHKGYLEECRRIVTLVAERYGPNPYIAAWHTDNEYGCHDTVLSYSEAARLAFRDWLRARYGSVDALNDAWGNIFWSMEYNSFDQIDLPNLTVTEPNPAHLLAFHRFCSDQVVMFNRVQTDVIRANSPTPIAHNYMGKITDFDHYDVGTDLDIASWDSYPLGFLEDRLDATPEHQVDYARQGDPDFQAFHHDLYRAVGAAKGNKPVEQGRWWVMEQQPGPVNWAPYNPAPLPGMVRLWTWEAFAHGAEAVCYFRWRQAPFAQEQLHAGLLRPDSQDAPAIHEARQVRDELVSAPEVQPKQAPVALVFDYVSDWMWRVQPQGKGLSYFFLVLDTYRALRRAGITVDVVPLRADAFSGYAAVFAPGLMHMPDAIKAALSQSDAQVVLGPRTAARDADFLMPHAPLPPAMPGLDVTVARLETLRPDMPLALKDGGSVTRYIEEIEGSGEVMMQTETGAPVAMRQGRLTYMAGWGDPVAMDRLVALIGAEAGVDMRQMPEGVRTRETASERFWFNHTTLPKEVDGHSLPPAGVLRVPLT